MKAVHLAMMLRARREAAAISGRRHRAPTGRASPVNVPHGLVVAYAKELVGLVDDDARWLRERMKPGVDRLLGEATHELRTDGGPFDDFTRYMEDLRSSFAKVVPKSRAQDLAGIHFKRVDRSNREGVVRQFKQAIGINVDQSEPWLAAQREAFVSENVSLITSIAPKMLDDVEATVLRSARTGARVEQTAARIESRFDVSRSRAQLIAVDQTNKLNASLTEARHREAGVDDYDWLTSQDERVRPGHARLNGRTFSYGKPPVSDLRTGARNNPGQDIRCRCQAIPNFNKLLARTRLVDAEAVE